MFKVKRTRRRKQAAPVISKGTLVKVLVDHASVTMQGQTGIINSKPYKDPGCSERLYSVKVTLVDGSQIIRSLAEKDFTILG